MAKAKQKPNRDASRLSLVALLLALLLPVVMALVAHDARGVELGWPIGLLWGVLTLLAFLAGLAFFAQYVLPRRRPTGWANALQMLIHIVLPDVTFEPRVRRPPRVIASSAGETLPPSFEAVHAGLLHSHQAVAIEKGNAFARAGGPGFVRLKSGERVAHLLDLRPHSRNQAVKAHTRDGIPLATSVSVTFRIRAAAADPRAEEIVYPYEPETIFQVTQAGSVDAASEPRPWTDQLAPQAATYLVSELGRYTLDQLTQSAQPLGEVKRELKQQMQRAFEQHGIEILGVGVGALNPPEDVRAQRVAYWRADWQRKIAQYYAAGDAEVVRRIKRARARAQVEIIQNITHSIEEMRRTEQEDLPEIVTLRMIEVLEDALAGRQAQKIIPEQMLAGLLLETSSQMRTLLGPPGEEDRDG